MIKKKKTFGRGFRYMDFLFAVKLAFRYLVGKRADLTVKMSPSGAVNHPLSR